MPICYALTLALWCGLRQERRKAGVSESIASATGIVEGQKESMDLLPYITPRDQQELRERFPAALVVLRVWFTALREGKLATRADGKQAAF